MSARNAGSLRRAALARVLPMAAMLTLTLIGATGPRAARAAVKPAPTRLASPDAAAGCAEDGYEPNNDCTTATPFAVGFHGGLQSLAGNDDWYKVAVPRNASLTVTLSFINSGGDIDMALFNACPGALVALSNGTTNTETFTYKNTGAANDYYVRVYLYSGLCNAYSMTIGLTSADNVSELDVPGGWTAPIVPRNDGTASFFSAPLPATLNGNTLGTYPNFAANLTGPDTSPQIDLNYFLDDSLFYAPYIPDNAVPQYWYSINLGPYDVRGGRHTLRQVADPLNTFPETNESDNVYSNQWVWSPLATVKGVANTRGLPPPKGTGVIFNSDGLTFTRVGSVAWVVSEAPVTPSDDYDLIVYDNYVGSTTGFSHAIGASQLGGNQTDFVVGHYSGTPTTVYPAITRFSPGGGGGIFAADQNDASGRNGNLVVVPAYSWTPVSLPAYRLTDVYEANMTVGITYYFTLRTIDGPPLSFEVFPGTAGGVYGHGFGESSTAFGTLQTLAFTAAVTGWHPIVVYRTYGTGADAPLTYDFEWNTGNFAGVPGTEAQTEVSFSGAEPNPVRAGARFELVMPRAGHVALGVLDVHGRMIRSLADGDFGAGHRTIEWDGRGNDGAPAAAGMYWARLQTGGRVLSRRFVVLR